MWNKQGFIFSCVQDKLFVLKNRYLLKWPWKGRICYGTSIAQIAMQLLKIILRNNVQWHGINSSFIKPKKHTAQNHGKPDPIFVQKWHRKMPGRKYTSISMVCGERIGEFLQRAFITFVIRIIIKDIKNERLHIKNLSAVWYRGKGPRCQVLGFKGQDTGILKW